MSFSDCTVSEKKNRIICPLCRQKYGSASPKYQEEEGAEMVRDFLSDCALTEGQIDRISFLVGHHHTLTGIDGPDYQILIEADYIVNACEHGYGKENIQSFMEKTMKTASGKRIAAAVLQV